MTEQKPKDFHGAVQKAAEEHMHDYFKHANELPSPREVFAAGAAFGCVYALKEADPMALRVDLGGILRERDTLSKRVLELEKQNFELTQQVKCLLANASLSVIRRLEHSGVIPKETASGATGQDPADCER